jgi:hypothetical protein
LSLLLLSLHSRLIVDGRAVPRWCATLKILSLISDFILFLTAVSKLFQSIQWRGQEIYRTSLVRAATPLITSKYSSDLLKEISQVAARIESNSPLFSSSWTLNHFSRHLSLLAVLKFSLVSWLSVTGETLSSPSSPHRSLQIP